MFLPRTACLFFPDGLDEPRLQRIAEACLRFSPRVAPRPGEAVFVETGKSRLLYSRQGLEARMRVLCRRTSPQPPREKTPPSPLLKREGKGVWTGDGVRIVFAADAATALALARFNETRPGRLPLEALYDYAAPFEHGAQTAARLEPVVESLKKLGLACLEEFLALGPGQLGLRFPKEAAGLWHQLKEGAAPAWPVFTPEEIVEEHASTVLPEAGQGTVTLEELLGFLKGALERALARLAGRGLRVSSLELALDLGDSPPRRLLFKLPLPQGRALGLARLLAERLAREFQERPLPAPVEALHLKILETAPALSRQAGLFSRREQEREEYGALVARLAQKLGEGRVFLARPVERYLPEAAWQKTMGEMMIEERGAGGAKDKNGMLPPRPARLLAEPEKLARQGEGLSGAGGKSWRVVESEGPERINGEWWEGTRDGFWRDYYRVTTEGGAHLWVFAVPARAAEGLEEPRRFADLAEGAEVYLHGYFD